MKISVVFMWLVMVSVFISLNLAVPDYTPDEIRLILVIAPILLSLAIIYKM